MLTSFQQIISKIVIQSRIKLTEIKHLDQNCNLVK